MAKKTKRLSAIVQARIALTEMGLLEPATDENGQIVMRDGQIVWRISKKGREEAELARRSRMSKPATRDAD